VTLLHPRTRFLLGFPIVVALAGSAAASDWPQWGGPGRDFRVDAELETDWPAEGPRLVWRRLLGDGYSAIAAAGDTVYTLYRAGDDEVAIAIDADTGRTRWSHRYAAAIPGYVRDLHGVGPRSTPLVTADLVFVVGLRGTLHALDRASGAPRWRRDLVAELGGSEDDMGYTASPLAWRDLIIAPVGGPGRAMVALRQADGGVAWKSGDFQRALSSPILIELAGSPQVVALLTGAVAGFDAATGAELWHVADAGLGGARNITTPAWDGADRIFVTSADGGSRMLRVHGRDGRFTAEQLWHSNRVRVQYTNALWRDDLLLVSNGAAGPRPLTAFAGSSGEIRWQDRDLELSHLVAVGDRLLALDDDGTLSVATLEPSGARIDARAQLVYGEEVRTPPTVAGGRVYVRTRSRLLALDLAKSTQ
jgi:outer membrane protein assembly factor BamB